MTLSDPNINSLSRKTNSGIILLRVFCFILVLLSGFLLLDKYKLSISLNKVNLFSQNNPKNTKQEVGKIIKDNYIQDTNSTNFDEGEIRGYVAALNDPYSEYLSSEEWAKFENDLNERYVGVGIRFSNKEEGYLVDEVLKNSPAEKSGVIQGDYITKIGDKKTIDIPFAEIANMIKGEANTTVTLTFLRSGEEYTKTITRQAIMVDQLTLSIQENIAIITISSFGDNLDDKMAQAVTQINNNNIKKVILDFRSNGGGVLNEAINIMSYFVPENTLLMTTKSNHESESYYSYKKSQKLEDVSVVVLQNKFSASASEIVSAGLRDLVGAKVVGETSFGKGVMQHVFSLSNGGKLKLTNAEWIPPKGISINKIGVKPDITQEKDQDPLQLAKSQFNK
jgi:carboxyl-terminal processing protease